MLRQYILDGSGTFEFISNLVVFFFFTIKYPANNVRRKHQVGTHTENVYYRDTDNVYIPVYILPELKIPRKLDSIESIVDTSNPNNELHRFIDEKRLKTRTM